MYETEFTPDDAVGIAIIAIGALIALIIFLAIRVAFLLSMKKALTRCSSENRTMSPGSIWLGLIPFFHIIWDFFIVINLADSLEREFQKRGLNVEPKPGKNIGLVYCIANVCSLIPGLNFLAGPVSFICWIIYWVKIAGFSKQIESPYNQSQTRLSVYETPSSLSTPGMGTVDTQTPEKESTVFVQQQSESEPSSPQVKEKSPLEE